MAAFPFIVHGEETKGNEAKLLESTVESVDKTLTNVGKGTNGAVKEVVKETATSVCKTVKDSKQFVEKTTTSISAPVKKKTVSATLNNTGELVDKAVKNTVPVAKTAVKETTKVADQTVTDVDAVVNSQLDELEKVPVVSPVVKEAGKTVKQVTNTVKETVKQTNEAVNKTVESVAGTTEKSVDKVTDAVDQVSELPTGDEKPADKPIEMPAVQPEEPKKEIGDEVPSQTGGEETANDSAKPALPEKEVTVKVGEKDLSQPSNETKNTTIMKRDIDKDSGKNNSEEKAENTFHEKPEDEVKTTTRPAAFYEELKKNTNQLGKEEVLQNRTLLSTNLPAASSEPEDKDASVAKPVHKEKKRNLPAVQTAIPAQPNNPAHGGAAASTPFSSDGSVSGTLTSIEVLQPAIDKLWYHKNSYALIQWFHTPLGKPPKTAPFLNVM